MLQVFFTCQLNGRENAAVYRFVITLKLLQKISYWNWTEKTTDHCLYPRRLMSSLQSQLLSSLSSPLSSTLPFSMLLLLSSLLQLFLEYWAQRSQFVFKNKQLACKKIVEQDPAEKSIDVFSGSIDNPVLRMVLTVDRILTNLVSTHGRQFFIEHFKPISALDLELLILLEPIKLP